MTSALVGGMQCRIRWNESATAGGRLERRDARVPHVVGDIDRVSGRDDLVDAVTRSLERSTPSAARYASR
jgi:hypothetical protein